MGIKQTLYILLLLLLASAKTYAQPNFLADTTSGCNTLDVFFKLDTLTLDTDTITAISWDFGNGQTSNLIEPDTVTYNLAESMAGVPVKFKTDTRYNVSVYFNNDTSTRIQKANYIILYKSFITDSFQIQELNDYNLALNPDNEQWRAPGISYYYRWNINDGSTAHEDTVPQYIHSLPQQGDYNITLFVRDSRGCASSSMQSYATRNLYNFPNVYFTNIGQPPILYQYNGITPIKFQVFTRYGIKVYESESPSVYWDGTDFSGNKLNNGVYFYHISATKNSDIFNAKGFIHLMNSAQ